MTNIHSPLSREERARRGDGLYERAIAPTLGAEEAGFYVVIDVDTGAYELDADEIAASDRLRARRPEAQVWLRQVGARGARRFGPRARTPFL